jgi:hypothetical protein
VLGLPSSALLDPWGHAYEYHLQHEPPGFDVVSAGADGSFGTDDDVKLSALGKAWEAGGVGVRVEDGGDGVVRIVVGDHVVTARGDEHGAAVSIDLGDRVIEIVDGEDAGADGAREPGSAEDGGGAAGAGDVAPPREDGGAPGAGG